MRPFPESSASQPLQLQVEQLLQNLPNLEHGNLIQQALATIVQLASTDADRLDWKILSASLQDMQRAFELFHPYRHVRKISIFGSARIQPSSPTYQMAMDFARCVTLQGFMVITGGGPGIMQAGNEGAGMDKSFGLNIQLPFEQGSNPFLEGGDKLVNFKYFFTRKLFFLRESDALALFPGGFGTQDEAFECLTLMQTGKSGLLPLVLLETPGDDYWQSWEGYIKTQLLDAGLISADDLHLYTITDRVDTACEAIASFYRVYHSSRYVGPNLVLRLNQALSEEELDYLNTHFSDILVRGKIAQMSALPQEADAVEITHLPRLVLEFNQRDLGRLYQMIRIINRLGETPPEKAHPEQK
ncbi:MAG: LOG family protein [Cyanobacteria bacterium J069]|nr:MAG: LOG family protein [Cyanobacteria bacterium J069]